MFWFPHIPFLLSFCLFTFFLHWYPVDAYTQQQIDNTPQTQRVAWCQQQTAICTVLCASGTKSNLCNFKSLQFDCTCSNGTSLALSAAVDQTIPFFTCQEYDWAPCFYSCAAGDQACQDRCNQQFVCGKVKADPTKNQTNTSNNNTTPTKNGSTTNSSETPVIQLNLGVRSIELNYFVAMAFAVLIVFIFSLHP